MPCAPRVLLIGLDAAEHQLIERWIASGELPVLGALRARGARGRLRTPVAMGDDAVWASFYTAVSPGRHGRYFFHTLMPRSYRMPFWDDAHLRAEPFWDALSRAGKRCAIIDVPKSPLSRSINGLQLADWRVHGRDHATCSTPPALAAEALSRLGNDRSDRIDQGRALCQQGYAPNVDYQAFAALLRESVADKLALCQDVLQQENWDLFTVVFKESHCAGHKLWHLQDPSHHQHPPRPPAEDADAMKSVYRALDDAVGRLLAHAAEDTTVVVFSDLGMAGNYTGNHLLDEVLWRLEMARLDLPRRAGLALRSAKLQVGRRLLGRTGEDYARRIRCCYAVPNGEQAAAVRLNLEGREAQGRVQPGAESEAWLDYLGNALCELKDPDTGRRLVSEVIRADNAFAGSARDRMPDLFAVWERSAPIFAVTSPLIGTIRRPDPQFRTGGHVANGWYLADGPRVRCGDAGDASINDLAPSVAALLGSPLADVDGRPIPALAGH